MGLSDARQIARAAAIATLALVSARFIDQLSGDNPLMYARNQATFWKHRSVEISSEMVVTRPAALCISPFPAISFFSHRIPADVQIL
jgi:hypothetical protein